MKSENCDKRGIVSILFQRISQSDFSSDDGKYGKINLLDTRQGKSEEVHVIVQAPKFHVECDDLL